MFWGVWRASGELHDLAPGPLPAGTPYPGHFNPAALLLTLGEEEFRFRYEGEAAIEVRIATKGWRSWTGASRVIPEQKCALLSCDDGLLFISGLRGPKPGAPLTQALLHEPFVRFFCFVRKDEFRGWWGTARRMFLGVVMTNEYWMVPSAKVLIRLQRMEPEPLRLIQSTCSEVPSPKELDEKVNLGLRQSSPWMRLGLLLGVPLAGLLGFGVSFGVALRFPPGSSAAVASVFVGIAFLLGSLVALPISSAVLRRRVQREGQSLERTLRARSHEAFLGRPHQLAQEFITAASRWGVPIEPSLSGLGGLSSVERFLIWPGREPWLPTVYRYAAFLAEVVAREERHRMRVEWIPDDQGPAVHFLEANVVADFLGYAQNRLNVAQLPREKRDPSSYVAEIKFVAELRQSAHPVELFPSLGIRPDVFRQGPLALKGFLESLGKPGEEERIDRPFGSFVVRRWGFEAGFGVQYAAFVRADSANLPEEPRSFRPVWDTERLQECAALEVHELPSMLEAIVIGDFGGRPGRPLVLAPLVTDFLRSPPGSIGPGQSLGLFVYGIGIGGEFLPPLPGQTAEPLFGSVQPVTPGGPADPRMRVSGIVEETRTVRFASERNQVYAFTLNVQGLRFPIAVDASRVRGSPTVGHAFTGDIWFQARLASGPSTPKDMGVA